MENYNLELILRDDLGNIISTTKKALIIRENSFDDIESEIYDFRCTQMPIVQKDLLENEQKKYKKNKTL